MNKRLVLFKRKILDNPDFFGRYVTAGFLVFIILIGLIKRYDFFIGQQLSYEHTTYYSFALGESVTGRWMKYGIPSGGIHLPLGPLVLYFWSLLLLIWESPLCLMILSLILNLLAIIFFYYWFRNRFGIMIGLYASAFISSAMPHISLAGETLPIMMLCMSVLLWLLYYVKGIESENGMFFAFSFVFLALALSCNAQGFLLIPVSIFIYKRMGARINYIWFMIGLYIVILSYYFYIDEEIATGFRTIQTFPVALRQFWLKGDSSVSYASRFSEFASNYFRIIGVFPGIVMFAVLLISLSVVIRVGTKTIPDKRNNFVIPWAFLHLFGFGGLFFANKESRFFLLYLIGSCGTTSWMFYLISTSRAKYLTLPTVVLLLSTMVLHPYADNRSNSSSRYTTLKLMDSMNEIFSKYHPNAYDVNNNFHTLIEDNIRPGLISLKGISTYLLLDSPEVGDSSMEMHALFFLTDDFDSELGNILKKRFPEIERRKSYVFFESQIDNKSWIYCPGRIADWPYGSWTTNDACNKFNRDFRNSFEEDIYLLYPELEKDISRREPPPWEPQGVYSLYVYFRGGAAKKNKLVIIQSIGCVGDRILYAEKFYNLNGQQTSTTSNEGKEYTCTVWLELPPEGGWLGFDWFYDPNVIDLEKYFPDLFIDVIDIDMVGLVPASWEGIKDRN